MDWRQVIIELFQQVSDVLGKALEGLTLDDISYQPNKDCNSIGWLAWHLSRSQDRAINTDIQHEEQLWIKDKWYLKFNRLPDPDDRGFGHTSEDVAAFKTPDIKTLLDYHYAVLEQTKQILGRLSTADLNRKVNHPRFPTTGARLVAVINDNLQHVGQVAYLRGLLKGKGWLGV